MIMKYGSFAYFLSIFTLIGIIIGLYFLLRNKSIRTKKIVFFSLVVFNVLQHLFKGAVWPHIVNNGFMIENSAYNMCAFLIIATPFVFVSKSKLWKDFITYLGINGGLVAILVPYWFIGQSIFTWEFLRFYVCHGLLLITSILPVLIGLHKVSFNNFWKIGFLFELALILVTFNNMCFIVAGKYGVKEHLYQVLYNQNPTWSMHPTDIFAALEGVIDFFSPDFLMNSATNMYVPVLWYFVPVYLLITFLAFIITMIFDKAGFKDFISKIKILYNRLISLFKKEKAE